MVFGGWQIAAMVVAIKHDWQKYYLQYSLTSHLHYFWGFMNDKMFRDLNCQMLQATDCQYIKMITFW